MITILLTEKKVQLGKLLVLTERGQPRCTILWFLLDSKSRLTHVKRRNSVKELLNSPSTAIQWRKYTTVSLMSPLMSQALKISKVPSILKPLKTIILGMILTMHHLAKTN